MTIALYRLPSWCFVAVVVLWLLMFLIILFLLMRCNELVDSVRPDQTVPKGTG